jgi:hypothetical protein
MRVLAAVGLWEPALILIVSPRDAAAYAVFTSERLAAEYVFDSVKTETVTCMDVLVVTVTTTPDGAPDPPPEKRSPPPLIEGTYAPNDPDDTPSYVEISTGFPKLSSGFHAPTPVSVFAPNVAVWFRDTLAAVTVRENPVSAKPAAFVARITKLNTLTDTTALSTETTPVDALIVMPDAAPVIDQLATAPVNAPDVV